MADKDLKSLTIDGVTMRNVYTDDEYGIRKEVVKNDVNIPANTDVRGDSITFTSAGKYYVCVLCWFGTATTTGTTLRTLNLERKVSGTSTMSTALNWNDGTNYAATHSGVYAIDVDTAPVEFVPHCSSQRPCTGNIYIYGFKLPKYPGVGG